MTDPDTTRLLPTPRGLISRRRLVIGSGAGVLGISLGRAVSGSDDKHDDDHDDDDRNDRKSDDNVRASGTAPAGSAEVIIDDDDADGFAPGTISIDLGGSVTWTNLDKDPHTAT